MLRLSRSSAMLRPLGRRSVCSTIHGSVDSPITPQTLTLPPVLTLPLPDDEAAVLQDCLKYNFANRTLLEEAITHPSYSAGHPSRRSYKPFISIGVDACRVEYEGHFGIRGRILDLNLSPHKLARAAIQSRFYQFLRRKSPKLDREVEDFINVQDGKVPYNGILTKVPKVLPELVFALFGAVTTDRGEIGLPWRACFTWPKLGAHFLPLYWWPTRHTLTTLECVCFDYHLSLDMKKKKAGDMYTTKVFINNILHGSHSSSEEKRADGAAALEALNRLPKHMLSGTSLDTPLDVKEALGLIKGYDDL